jgi:hypothetical protein
VSRATTVPATILASGPVALVCLPPRGNVSHLVRRRPTPDGLGRTWCGRTVFPRARIVAWESGPDLDAHLERRRLCRMCAAAVREATRPPPPPVARVEVAAVALRCPHCFAPQWRSDWGRDQGDDTWPLDYFSGMVRSRACPACNGRMTLPGDPAAEAMRQAQEG